MLNLKQANKLIEQIASDNEHITPVTLNDFELFQRFFEKEPHTYGNSWTYVTQGVYGIGPDNLGYKYYDGENLSMVCVYPKIEDSETNVFYWIRPMGKDILDKIIAVSGEVKENFGLNIMVKKLFEDQYNHLLQNGFQSTSEFPWHSQVPSEDDTFPEQIVDVQKTLVLSKTISKKKHLRKSIVRVDQLKSNKNVEIFTDKNEEDMWNITKEFFHSDLIKSRELNLSTEYDYYNMIFSNPGRTNLQRALIKVDGSPLGYFVLEKLGDYSNLYALIILRDRIKYLVDFAMIYILDNLDTKYLNLGGSEEEGIHNFKQKYLPLSENKMYWCVGTV